MNVTVRNVITSMRLMSAVDWAEFFESVSLVDAALRAGSDFAAMDFPTRDRYRHAIEELARGSAHSELEVARARVVAARRAGGRGGRRCGRMRREQDPGYYLISDGRRAFESELGFRVPLATRLIRAPTSPRASRLSRDDRAHHRRHPRPPAPRGRREQGRGPCSVLLALLALVPASERPWRW